MTRAESQNVAGHAMKQAPFTSAGGIPDHQRHVSLRPLAGRGHWGWDQLFSRPWGNQLGVVQPKQAVARSARPRAHLGTSLPWLVKLAEGLWHATTLACRYRRRGPGESCLELLQNRNSCFQESNPARGCSNRIAVQVHLNWKLIGACHSSFTLRRAYPSISSPSSLWPPLLTPLLFSRLVLLRGRNQLANKRRT